MIVWLASYPRSGNGFVRRIILDMYGIRTRSIYKRDFDLGNPLGRDAQLTEMAESCDIHFLKTHRRMTEDPSPAIYLIRDGRDSLVSYAWYALTVDGGREMQDVPQSEFRQTLYNIMMDQRSEFGTWSDNVRWWMSRPHTHVIRFENLITSPEQAVADALRELDLSLEPKSGAQPPDFADLQKKKPKIYRRGKVGSWQDEFPADMLDDFWSTHGDMMRMSGYGREDPRYELSGASPPPERLPKRAS